MADAPIDPFEGHDPFPPVPTEEQAKGPVRSPQEFAALQQRGQQLGLDILEAVFQEQANAPRSLQSEKRVLGPSELGGCREYIRASIAGDPKAPQRSVKWAAYLGTVTGDAIEGAISRWMEGAVTQERVRCTLPNGMVAVGSLDARIGRKIVLDLKSKDGITDIMSEGPSLKNLIQISTYLKGSIQAGIVDDDAIASLVHFDRSGSDKRMYVFTIDHADADYFLDLAVQRLNEVAEAMAQGVSQSYLRDEPESWCYHVQCPFYQACWGSEEYNPSAPITAERHVTDLRLYDKMRAIEKAAKTAKDGANKRLFPDRDDDKTMVQGITNDGLSLKWKLTSNAKSGLISYTIDVRRR